MRLSDALQLGKRGPLGLPALKKARRCTATPAPIIVPAPTQPKFRQKKKKRTSRAGKGKVLDNPEEALTALLAYASEDDCNTLNKTADSPIQAINASTNKTNSGTTHAVSRVVPFGVPLNADVAVLAQRRVP